MVAKEGRERLDQLLVRRGLAASRERAQQLILAGAVSVGERVVDKPGTQVPLDVPLTLAARPPYASRGGLKLAAALEAFALDVRGWVAADVGASTGGFTDCLLQRGAARVYAIDVGYGQLAWELRRDPRVVVLDRTNARFLEHLPEPVDLVTADVSFISLRLILPPALGWLGDGGHIVALVKPQFEAGRDRLGKGGVVRDPSVHGAVLTEITAWAAERGLGLQGLIRSPVTGPAGNVEFLAWWLPGSPDRDDPATLIGACLVGGAG
ncbi:MAG TPA: TlyA family RNA methyltransferase [Anaerolineae bacterium]|nr:TlyA family RNA methyltransferase [Anaerolineae bacterium]